MTGLLSSCRRRATAVRWPALASALSLVLVLTALQATSRAQATAKGDEPKKDAQPNAPEGSTRASATTTATATSAKPFAVKEPVPWRVYQRSGEDRADIPIVLGDGATPDMLVSASLSGANVGAGTGVYRDGKFQNVPTGGPYQVQLRYKTDKSEGAFAGGSERVVTVGPVFVGDLWVLAGQSNMQGVGNLTDVTPPSDRVMALGMDDKWVRAEEPLHWLVDSPDPVHSGNPADRAARSEAEHKTRTKGAGLGLPFGVVMASATNVPVGLIVSAHGGTSMAQWDPAKKGEGGNSLYGSMLRQIKLAGGKVRGILWYQGESDANGEAAKVYPKAFADFIAAVRNDLGQQDLPFYFVQIGRFVNPGAPDPKPWNAVQDAQRELADRIPNTAVVASVDLELDDLIHVGTPGLKRLGTRLARIALRELFGQVGATTPMLDRVTKLGDQTLVVKFKGANRAPSASGPPRMGRNAAVNVTLPLNGLSSGSMAGVYLDGLQPARHIAGFSIRKADGTEIPLIYDAAVGQSKDTVVLKLLGKVPDGALLYYGYGLDPYCNLTDALDMAVPVFGPIALDDIK